MAFPKSLRHFVLCLLSFGLIFIGSKASAKDFWLGFVSPGGGLGFFGHGLIVVTEPKQDPLLGLAYSYSFEFKKQLGINPTIDYALVETGVYGETRGVLEKEPFFVHYRLYSIYDQRAIFLQKLNLSDSEQNSLINLLEEELHHPSNTGYSVVNNNCLTFMLNTISKVVDPEKQIYTQQLNHFLIPSLKTLKSPSASILSRVPFLAPYVLRKNPLLSPEHRIIRPFSEQQQEEFEKFILPLTTELGACLQFHPDIIKILELNVALSIKTENEGYLLPISKQVRANGSCLETAKKLYGHIFNAVPPNHGTARTRFYQAKMTLTKETGDIL